MLSDIQAYDASYSCHFSWKSPLWAFAVGCISVIVRGRHPLEDPPDHFFIDREEKSGDGAYQGDANERACPHRSAEQKAQAGEKRPIL